MSSPTQLDYAVDCRGLTKHFGRGDTGLFALRGVDLTVCPGELTLLVGPSGCGKTTLLSVMAGILNPTDGSVRVLGEDLMQMSDSRKVDFRGRNIGFVFQQFNLLPALTAAENVTVPLIIAGWSKRRAMAASRLLLHQMDMSDRADAIPAELSGGQQQRVAIARALVHEPRLVVCDEPTSAIDHQTGKRIMDLLRRIAVQHDRAVIVVTHDRRVFDFANRIAHMDDGRIVDVERREGGSQC